MLIGVDITKKVITLVKMTQKQDRVRVENLTVVHLEGLKNGRQNKMQCPKCLHELKEENYGYPGCRGDILTLLECKKGHAYQIKWKELTIQELEPPA
jgi:hypothetical protein